MVFINIYESRPIKKIEENQHEHHQDIIMEC